MTGLRTFKEAAEWLHISESWLRKEVAARRVPHTRLGRNVRFSESDLAAIAKAGQVEARSSVAASLRRKAGAA